MINISLTFDAVQIDGNWQIQWDLAIILLLFQQNLGNCTQRSILKSYKNCRENMEMKRNNNCVWMRLNITFRWWQISTTCFWNLSVTLNFFCTIFTTEAQFLHLCVTESMLSHLLPLLPTLSHLNTLSLVFIFKSEVQQVTTLWLWGSKVKKEGRYFDCFGGFCLHVQVASLNFW